MTLQESTSPPAGRTAASIFEYQRAETWADAVELLGIWDGEAKILAGGQSLIPMLNLRLAFPEALIDINPIPAACPHLDGGYLVIDANTRHSAVASSQVVREHAPLLAHAIEFIGNVRVRNRGTIGGSLAHADPTAEIPAVVLAMQGQIVVLGPQGERTIPAEEFFVTYLTTAIEPDELIVGVRLPVAGHARWRFHEVVRRYSDFATVSVSVIAHQGMGWTDLRVVIGGVADRPILVDSAHLAPALSAPGASAQAKESADAIVSSLDPETDLHATADYRRRLVAVHTRRLLQDVLGQEGQAQ